MTPKPWDSTPFWKHYHEDLERSSVVHATPPKHLTHTQKLWLGNREIKRKLSDIQSHPSGYHGGHGDYNESEH